MKVTIKQVVECYKALGEAKVTNLEDADKIKILKARKAMRPTANEYEAFEKDCQEAMKYEGFNADIEPYTIAHNKIRQGKGNEITEDEAKAYGRVMEYDIKIRKALHDEQNKDVEIEIEKLSEGSDIKLMSANDWTPNQLDLIEIVL